MYIKLSSCILNDAYIRYFIFPANVKLMCKKFTKYQYLPF